MPSSDENFPRKNDRTFHQRCLSRARDEPAETPLAPANEISTCLKLKAILLRCTRYLPASNCLQQWSIIKFAFDRYIMNMHNSAVTLFSRLPLNMFDDKDWPCGCQTLQSLSHRFQEWLWPKMSTNYEKAVKHSTWWIYFHKGDYMVFICLDHVDTKLMLVISVVEKCL